MRVEIAGGEIIELGTTETAPTIGITDFSRRVTDDYGVTTVVERGFARRMSVRLAVPFDEVSAIQRRLASLRATPALWVADDTVTSLSVEGFYKGFEIDLSVPPTSFCSLTVEGLLASDDLTDNGADPAADGKASTLRLLQPLTIDDAALVSSNVPETDHPEWAAGTAYGTGARVIRTSTHRIYESATDGNVGNDPSTGAAQWIEVGASNRWAMFDQALGSATAKASPIIITLDVGAPDALALLDVAASTVRVEAFEYDRTEPVTNGSVLFLDLPDTAGPVKVTIAGPGLVSVGTLLLGQLVGLGITEAAPTAGISDFSRKDVDDFGEATIVERAWAKRMSVGALIRSDAIDVVYNRIAAVRATPSLWIGDESLDVLTIYGFFKDFAIEVGEVVSKLSLTIEGLSKAAPPAPSNPPVRWLGEWSEDYAYPKNAVVRFLGRSFASLIDNNINHQPPSSAADDTFWYAVSDRGEDGTNGGNGIPGPPGANGQTTYVHFAWADSADGSTGFSTTVSAGKLYVGVYTDFTLTSSTNPALYNWALIKGADGASSWGQVFTPANSIKKEGDGNFRSLVGSAELRSRESFVGGAQLSFAPTTNGLEMASGLHAGAARPGGSWWVSIGVSWHLNGVEAFAVSHFGPALQTNFGAYNQAVDRFSTRVQNGKAQWLKNDNVVQETPVSNDLEWWAFCYFGNAGVTARQLTFTSIGKRGDDGLGGAGVPGPPGANGQTTYVHFAYADSIDGTVNFTTEAAEGRYFVGVYTDFVQADSTSPAAYTWSLWRGANGTNGIPGPPGSNGQPTYVHTAYANNATGTLNFDLSDPSGRTYLGVYTDFTLADSSNPALYSWSLIKGADGAPGADALTVSSTPPAVTVPTTSNGTPLNAIPGFSIAVYKGSANVTATSAGTSYAVTGSSGLSGISHVGNGVFTVAGMPDATGWVEVAITNVTTAVVRVTYAKVAQGGSANAIIPTGISFVNDSATYAVIATASDIAVAAGQTLQAAASVIWYRSGGYASQGKLTYQNITDGGAEVDFPGSEVVGYIGNLPQQGEPGSPSGIDTSGAWTNGLTATKVMRVRFYFRRSSGSGSSSGVEGSLGAHT